MLGGGSFSVKFKHVGQTGVSLVVPEAYLKKENGKEVSFLMPSNLEKAAPHAGRVVETAEGKFWHCALCGKKISVYTGGRNQFQNAFNHAANHGVIPRNLIPNPTEKFIFLII